MTPSLGQRSGWNAADNLLCIRLDALGDVLMTTPALRALKEGRPGRKLTLLTSPSGAAAANLIAQVDEVLVYEAPWMKATPPRSDGTYEMAIIETLRAKRFDGAVIFTVYSQNPLPSAFLCYLAGIPRRLAHCHENPYQLLTDWVADPEPQLDIRHEVRRQLDLVASIGCQIADERLTIAIPPIAKQRARAKAEALGVDFTRPVFAVHPGTTAASRRYPEAGFAAITRALASEGQIVFTGSPEEADLVGTIQTAMEVPSVSLAGCLDLAEFGGFLAAASLLIANNTGPVHVAAAVGTPVVDLYALTNPQHTPWRVPAQVLYRDVACRFCYKSVCPKGHNECLHGVRPEDVVAAAKQLLADPARFIGAGDDALAAPKGGLLQLRRNFEASLL